MSRRTETSPPTTNSPAIRCAIYTRKSHEEGLDQEFNSLDAQREAGEAYIESQKLQGWRLLPERYDDGGFSGGSTERPALQRLLVGVAAGKVDVIVVYKLDRLSRSLLDFIKMIEVFNEHGVSFVSVTQQISTTDSHGRMMLNILMTFAQYEREIIGDRIRDKVAAAKRRGKYCGGVPILGYDVDPEKKRLRVSPEEAKLVQFIFRRFSQLGSAKRLVQELNKQGYHTKAWTTRKSKVREGTPWNTAHVYRILSNRIYLGEVVHKDQTYPGEHEALVTQAMWDKARAALDLNYRMRTGATRSETVALLKGVIRCGHCGCAMGPTYTRKNGKQYHYYLCVKASKEGTGACPVRRVSAGEVEKAVMEQLGAVFRSPALVARTFFVGRERDGAERLSLSDGVAFTEQGVMRTFLALENFWDDLFPAEKNRLIHLLIETATVREDGLELIMRTHGLDSLVAELTALAGEAEGRTAA